MNKYFIIAIITILSCICMNAQTDPSQFNTPVKEDATLSCKVIKPLSVHPKEQENIVITPSIPAGQKLVLAENAVWSQFTFTGEPDRAIKISMVPEKVRQKVEIDFVVRGRQDQYTSTCDVTNLDDGVDKVVNLSAGDGKYYLVIVYVSIWAYEDAVRGERIFTQHISAIYDGL